MRRLWYYYLYLLITWGLFRYFVHLPEVIEELWFKPLIWLVPLFWWGLSLPKKLVMFGNKWGKSAVIGLVAGVAYYLLIRRFNLQGSLLNVNVIGVAIATAITEELVFSGFVMGYLERVKNEKWMNLLLVGGMVALIRLPILLFVYKLGLTNMVGVFLFSGASGMINAWIRTETGNVLGSVLARVGLNLAVLS